MGWALCIALTGAFLVNCVPLAAAERPCECCTSDSLQAVRDFTIAKVVTVPAPSSLSIVDLSVHSLLDSFEAWSHYALHHRSRFTTPGVPRYLLASTLLI